MPKRISALVTSLEPYTVPKEIVFIPEGSHLIYPQSHPKGIEVNMPAAMGTQVAAALDKQLGKMREGNVRPRLDFDHKGSGPASGFPTAFRYEPGKGLMCAVDWSNSGKASLEGGDYGYFSPVVDIDDNGVPAALPDRGPLGGLVNDPAFREMPRVAAGAAEDPPNHSAMPNELVTCGLLTETEAARENAGALAKSRVAAMREDGDKLETLRNENTELKAKLAEAEEAAKKERKEEADKLIEAAIDDGRLDPEDKETVEDYRGRIIAGEAFARKALEGLARKHEDIDRPVVVAAAADGKPANNQKRIEAAQAKARAELGANADFPTIWARAAEIDPPAFQ